MILAAGFFFSCIGALGLCIWMVCRMEEYKLPIPRFLTTCSAAFAIGIILMVVSVTIQIYSEGAMP